MQNTLMTAPETMTQSEEVKTVDCSLHTPFSEEFASQNRLFSSPTAYSLQSPAS
jgi:hypothetical protein